MIKSKRQAVHDFRQKIIIFLFEINKIFLCLHFDTTAEKEKIKEFPKIYYFKRFHSNQNTQLKRRDTP